MTRETMMSEVLQGYAWIPYDSEASVERLIIYYWLSNWNRQKSIHYGKSGDMRNAEQTRIEMHPPRILVAEDDNDMREMLVIALKKEKYHVIECCDGRELLDCVSSYVLHGDSIGISLIISDIRMPKLNGLTVLERLRQRNTFLPVILITAFGDVGTHQEAKRLGAAECLDKPFELDELVKVVHRLVPPVPPVPQEGTLQ